MEASSPVLTRSITIMARRLSSRSSRTPARGPKTSGGMVCKTPISDIFSAESVIAYTNHRRATLLTPSPT